MTFIEVTAQECNVQGVVGQGSIPTSLKIHKDLIGGFNGTRVLPREGMTMKVGGKLYTNIAVRTPGDIDKL